MRKISLVLLLSLVVAAAFAVPAKPGIWKTVKLADGTEIRVELRGDEFCKYWRSADGRHFVENPSTGLFEKADMAQLVSRANARRSLPMRTQIAQGNGDNPGGPMRVSYTGKKKGLIILVQFKDTKFRKANTPELYNRLVNEIGFVDEELGFRGSVKDYFLAQSYGQMEFDFDIAGPVTLPYSYKYYGRNFEDGSEKNVGEMIVEACKAVDDEIDFKNYDWDGDNNVEQVFILYAGHGEASYTDPYAIWPHKYDIYSATGERLMLDGVRVNTYACSCELGTGTKIDGIGTICHEFSHCLGLPDFYDVMLANAYGGAYGTSDWDIMCSGVYNGDSFCPAGFTAYERMAVGWLNPVVLKNDVKVEGMKPLDESPEAYIIYNDNDENEFYLLENRQATGWDEYLPGAGLLVTHVDYNSRAWLYNVPNSPTGQQQYGIANPHEMYSVVAADNSKSMDDVAGDVYPFGGNDSITNLSVPEASLFNANSDGSFLLNKSVLEIKRNGDGTMSFSFENHNKNTSDYDLPESYLFYESFDKCNGSGGNDGKFSGSVVGKGNLYADNEGWTSSSSHGADRCAMFGSSVAAGSVTTPEINIGGECHLLFRAAPYTGDGTTLTLKVESGNAKLSETELTMTENVWTVYDVTVTGAGKVRLTMEASKRFFLDKVCVTGDAETGISDVTTSETERTGRCGIYTIDGRYVGRDCDKLGKGIYIVDGKKIMR